MMKIFLKELVRRVSDFLWFFELFSLLVGSIDIYLLRNVITVGRCFFPIEGTIYFLILNGFCRSKLFFIFGAAAIAAKLISLYFILPSHRKAAALNFLFIIDITDIVFSLLFFIYFPWTVFDLILSLGIILFKLFLIIVLKIRMQKEKRRCGTIYSQKV